MTDSSTQQSSTFSFNEVVLADFGPFQIAVLTATRLAKRQFFSAHIPVPERTYQTQGWLLFNQQLIAHLDHLKISAIFTDDDAFNPLRRLAPAVPLSFGVKSSQPLPLQVTQQAAFACKLEETDFPYHTIFRQISPQFVRIYPFNQRTNLLKEVQKLLKDEADFVRQNQQQLKKVPFFQTRFSL